MHSPLPITHDPILGPCLFVDNSLAMDKLGCPTEFNLSFNRRLTAAGSKPALSFGQAIHSGIAHRYKALGNKAVTPEVQEQINTVLSNHFIENPQQENEFRTLTLATNLLTAYNKFYQNEEFDILEGVTGPHIEHSFAHLLCEIPYFVSGIGPTKVKVFFIGRIDMIIVKNGSTLIVDHKTSSMYGQTFWDDMHMAAQFPGYAWAYRKTYGVKPWGIMIDALRIRRPTKKDTQEAEYGGVENTFRRDDFIRDDWPISDDRINEWESNTISAVEEIFYYDQKGYYPMRTSQCVKKYGQCQFYNVCSIPRSSRENALDSGEFVKNVWSPLNKPLTTAVT